MAISSVRERFLDRLSGPPSKRIALSAKEAAAERQVEMDRVDRLQNLDGSKVDRDTLPGFVNYKHPGDGMFPPTDTWGVTQEVSFNNQAQDTLTYSYNQNIHLGLVGADGDAAPVLFTSVSGSNNRETSTWNCERYSEGPKSLTYEKLHLDYANPEQSFKEVWLMNG